MLENKRCPKCYSDNICSVCIKQFPELNYFICGSCTHTDKIHFLVKKNIFTVGIKRLLTICKKIVNIIKSYPNFDLK